MPLNLWNPEKRKKGARVIVCGGRDYRNRRAVFEALDLLHATRKVETVIHGGASGADSLAEEWAKSRRIRRKRCPADWARHGKNAGSRRNREMLHHDPDLVVAFPGGRGTENMTNQARAARVFVWEPEAVNPTEE